MKLICTLVFIILLGSLFACSSKDSDGVLPNSCRLKEIVLDDPYAEPVTVEKFVYNDARQLTRKDVYHTNGGHFLHYYIFEHTTDGRLHKSIKYTPDGQYQLHTEFEYDQNGNVSKASKFISEFDSVFLYDWTDFTYQNQQLVKQTLYRKFDGDFPNKYRETTFQYDTNGNISHEKIWSTVQVFDIDNKYDTRKNPYFGYALYHDSEQIRGAIHFSKSNIIQSKSVQTTYGHAQSPVISERQYDYSSKGFPIRTTDQQSGFTVNYNYICQ